MYKFYEKIHLYSNSQDMNLIDLIQIFFCINLVSSQILVNYHLYKMFVCFIYVRCYFILKMFNRQFETLKNTAAVP